MSSVLDRVGMDKKISTVLPVVEQAVLALRRLSSALAVSNRVVGARLHIRSSDLVVLDTLHQDGPQTPTELAYRTRTHLATMTGVLGLSGVVMKLIAAPPASMRLVSIV